LVAGIVISHDAMDADYRGPRNYRGHLQRAAEATVLAIVAEWLWWLCEHDLVIAISAEQLAGVSRLALRAYDACQAGDEQDARALFDRLSKMTF
jgi:hypothetical protein